MTREIKLRVKWRIIGIGIIIIISSYTNDCHIPMWLFLITLHPQFRPVDTRYAYKKYVKKILRTSTALVCNPIIFDDFP